MIEAILIAVAFVAVIVALVHDPDGAMTDEPEVVDGEVADGPDPELKPAVDEKLPDVQLAVTRSDPADAHEVMVRMDDHDVAMLLEEIQTKALRRWVYKLPGNKGEGLTVHAVQDIVQRMNWTGKAKIGLLLDANGRAGARRRDDRGGRGRRDGAGVGRDRVREG
jgi:hypothetical protein